MNVSGNLVKLSEIVVKMTPEHRHLSSAYIYCALGNKVFLEKIFLATESVLKNKSFLNQKRYGKSSLFTICRIDYWKPEKSSLFTICRVEYWKLPWKKAFLTLSGPSRRAKRTGKEIRPLWQKSLQNIMFLAKSAREARREIQKLDTMYLARDLGDESLLRKHFLHAPSRPDR